MKKLLGFVVIAIVMVIVSPALAGWGADGGDPPVQVGMIGDKPTVLIPVSKDQPAGAGNWQICASLPSNGAAAGTTMTAAAVTTYDPQSRIITATFDPPPASLHTTDWWIWGIRSSAGMDACKAGAAGDWLRIIQKDDLYQMGCRNNPGYRFSFSNGVVSKVTGKPCRN